MEVARLGSHSCLPEGEKVGSLQDRNHQTDFYIKMQLVFLLLKKQSLMLLGN